MNQQSEWNEFVRQLVERDETSCAEVVDRYAQRLISLVDRRLNSSMTQRVDAEDVVQSVFRSFFRRTHEFQLRRSGDLWRLLATIAVNKVRKQVARQQADKRDYRRETLSETDAEFELRYFNEPKPDEVVAFQELLQHVVGTFSPLQQRVFEMRLEGDSVGKISIALGKSQRTIRRALQDVRTELVRRLLDDAE